MSSTVVKPQPSSAAVKPPPPELKLAMTSWEEAFDSETFRKISRKRFGFVIPALLSFSVMFLVFWIIQSIFPNIARHRVYGYINVNFVYTMLIFPVVWILGLVFVQYTRRKVYPLEDELNRRFGKGPKHE